MAEWRSPVPNGPGTETTGKHVFTVDLEDWFHGIELPEASWPTESRLQVGLDRLLALLDRHEVRATFFVLGAVAERLPTVVSALAAAGHEIGCHGFAHQFVYRQSPDEFRTDLRRARDAIADATGHHPRGYRAPYFSLRQDSLWALEILAEEGFAYDSSILPVQNYRYGMPDAPRSPHWRDTAGGPVFEVPLTTVRMVGRNLLFSGGAYLRILPWWTQRAAWAICAHRPAPVVLYIHPWELDPDHPVVDLPRRVAATHYARLGLTEERLRRLLSRYEFGRLDEVFAVA